MIRPRAILLVMLILLTVFLGGTTSPMSADQVSEFVQGASYSGAIFPASKGREAPVETGGKLEGYWTPSPEVVRELEAALPSALKTALTKPSTMTTLPGGPQGRNFERETRKILNQLGRYRRQYLGVVVSGEKRVWVNCFLSEDQAGRDVFHYWRERFVDVEDGGFGFWQVQYEVQGKRFVDFSSNGYA